MTTASGYNTIVHLFPSVSITTLCCGNLWHGQESSFWHRNVDYRTYCVRTKSDNYNAQVPSSSFTNYTPVLPLGTQFNFVDGTRRGGRVPIDFIPFDGNSCLENHESLV